MKKENTTVINRINRIMEYLSDNNNSFADRIGVDRSNLSKMLKGQRTIGEAIINKIVLTTPFRKEWLQDGIGDPLISEDEFRNKKGNSTETDTPGRNMLISHPDSENGDIETIGINTPINGATSPQKSIISNEITTVKQRLIAFIKYKGLSQARFEKSVGLSNGFVNNISKGIGADKLQKILYIYPELNQDWLIIGAGNMLNTYPTQPTREFNRGEIITDEEKYEEALANGFPLLPEVDFKFAAGQTTLIDNSDNINRYWYLPDCKDCEGIAQVVGNSMSPALPSGCWVALKRHFFSIERANQIPFGNVFGIVVEDPDTGDYHGYIKVLRRYREQELSRKYWIAHSINESEFDDFDIDISQVRGLWIVKQHIVSDTLL